MYDGAAGKQRSYSGATRAEAEAGPNREANRQRRDAAARDGVTVGAFLTGWLITCRQTRKPATWRRYDSLLRLHILPRLGDRHLSEVRPEHLTGLYAELQAQGLGPTSVHHVHVVLGTGLQAAVDQGRLAANPQRTVKAPRTADRDWTILTRDEAKRLLDVAQDTNDRLSALYALALTTGMREGELLALRWRDVGLSENLEHRSAEQIRVNGTVTQGLNGKAEIGPPKTKAARRTVYLPARAALAIDNLHRDVIDAAADGRARKQDLLFPAERGGILTGTNLLNRHFHPLLARADLPRMRFHDLRHTAITHMLEDGTPPHVVMRLVGHASVAVTLGLYGHVTPALDDQATAAMDRRYPVPSTTRNV